MRLSESVMPHQRLRYVLTGEYFCVCAPPTGCVNSCLRVAGGPGNGPLAAPLRTGDNRPSKKDLVPAGCNILKRMSGIKPSYVDVARQANPA